MKNILLNGAIIMLVIAIFYIIFLRECKKPEPCPPPDQVLVSQKTWDSILILANMPPTIKIKKEYIKGDTVFIYKSLPVPVPDLQDTTIKVFHDSLVNEKIDAWVDFRLRGELLDFRWGYVPITTNITLEKTVYVPKIVDREVPVPKAGLFLSGLAGGNISGFMYGGSLDLITKHDNLYGLQFQRLGNENFYSFRLGAKIRL
jgi:hypothetical protein